jgi:hypothetical protein
MTEPLAGILGELLPVQVLRPPLKNAELRCVHALAR